MASIALTKGKTAVVDDKDYYELSKYKWHSLNGYAARRGKQGESRYVRMHRVVAEAEDGMEVDHINGDPLDNRRENLRVCTHAENLKNRKLNKNNKSGYKGVRWHVKDKKWRAEIQTLGKNIFLGNYSSKEEAAIAYNEMAKKLFKSFANLNQVIA